jgi:DNA polymerase-3 subunit delta
LANSSSLETFRTLYKSIKKEGTVPPVCYLYGEETFLIDLIQDEIEKLIPEDQKDFNFDLIYARESTATQVLNIAGSFPMMADKRIVIVRDFLRLDENSEDGGINEFTGYIKRPNPSTILCMIDSKFPDKRREFGKQLSKRRKESNYGIYGFEPIEEHQLPGWIMDWARYSHQREMSPKSAHLLAQLTGPNLKQLSTEIEKLCTFVDSSEVISPKHVKNVTELSREFNVIELKEAVIQKNRDKALHIAEQMLLRTNNSTGEIIKTVGFLYSVYSNIWLICRLRESGLSKDQIQKQSGIGKAFYYNFKDASNFRLAEMPGIFEALLDADSAIKGFSTLDTPSIFLLLIERITR